MGASLSAPRQHRRVETTSSQELPAPDSGNCHYRSLLERRPSKKVRCDSSPTKDVVAMTIVPAHPKRTDQQTNSRIDVPPTSPPPTPVMTTTTSSRKPSFRKSVSSKFLARFARKNTGQMSFAKSIANKKKIDSNGPFQDCDSGCLQEETSFSIVDPNHHQIQPQQPCERRTCDVRPEANKRMSHSHLSTSRSSVTANRITSSFVSRYRSVSSFFARSSSAIGPVNGEVVTTRIAYRDGNGNEIEHEERRQPSATKHCQRGTVSIVISETAAVNDAFDVNCLKHATCHADIAGLIASHGNVSTGDLLLCLDVFIRTRCRLRETSPRTNQRERLGQFRRGIVTSWLKTVDQSLLVTGWQDAPFIDPVSIVVVFLVLRDAIEAECRCSNNNDERNIDGPPPSQHRVGKNKTKNSFRSLVRPKSYNRKSRNVQELMDAMMFETVDDLRTLVVACLYVTYSYVGSEISYPLKPFLFGINRRMRIIDDEGFRDEFDEDDDDFYDFPYNDDVSYSDDDYDGGFNDSFAVEWRQRFWNQCLAAIDRSSSSLLKLNSNFDFFSDVLEELLAFRPSSSSTSSSLGASLLNGWRRPSHPQHNQPSDNHTSAWTNALLRREM